MQTTGYSTSSIIPLQTLWHNPPPLARDCISCLPREIRRLFHRASFGTKENLQSNHLIKTQNIKAHFTNTNTVVKQMLDAVNKNRKQRNSGYHNIAVTHFQEREQLNQLLSLI